MTLIKKKTRAMYTKMMLISMRIKTTINNIKIIMKKWMLNKKDFKKEPKPIKTFLCLKK
jgi:hypothetical protein